MRMSSVCTIQFVNARADTHLNYTRVHLLLFHIVAIFPCFECEYIQTHAVNARTYFTDQCEGRMRAHMLCRTCTHEICQCQG